MNNDVPAISVIVSTRNRGRSVVATLESVFKSNHPAFEVILVDQSTNQDTAQSVTEFKSDLRFRYFHSETQGLGVSRNIGLKLAQGEFVAYTDDDCTVPTDWLEEISKILSTNPDVVMVSCSVEPAPYDHSKGYIPAYSISKDRIIRSMRDLFWGLGIGAGMAFRREKLISIGGFDNCLGAGTRFRAGEDCDIAIRIVLNNWWIYESSSVTVTHFGFRSWLEGKVHAKGDFFSIGATYIKPIKCGYWKAWILFVSVPLLRGWLDPFISLLHGRRPRGFTRLISFTQGVVEGLKTQVDCRLVLYKPSGSVGSLDRVQQ